MAFKFFALCSLLAFANAGLLHQAPVAYSVAPVQKVAIANPSVDAVGATHENVVRSFGGTVSTHSKAVDTPYSSVRKTDTRINNNVYTPAVAKTVTYAAPAPVTYAHAPAPVAYAAPAVTYAHAAPVTKTISYAAPVAKTVTYAAPAPVTYTHAAPVAKAVTYAAPAATYAHVAAPVAYAAAPVAKAVTYAAAPAVTYAAAPVAKTVSYAAPVATTNINHGSDATTYTHNAPGVSAYGSSQTVQYSPANMVSHMTFDGFGTHWGL